MRFVAAMPRMRNTRNRTRKSPARNLAIAIDAPAMVVKPSSAATRPITRKTSAIWSMTSNLRDELLPKPCRMSYRRAVEAQSPDMQAFLDAAIAEAEQGLAEGGIPIGAVLVHRGAVIGRGHNRRVQHGSAVLH